MPPTIRECLEEVDLWISEGFPVNRTTAAIGVNRSLYYHHNQSKGNEENKDIKRGRPIPGFSLTNDGKRISDEQIEEWLMEAVEG
jgi:putative transposase